MIRFAKRSIHAASLAAGLLLAHPLPADKVTVEISPNPTVCTVVHLPKWKAPAMPRDEDWPDGLNCDYDFRSLDGGLLVGLWCHRFDPNPRIYSPTKYAVLFGSGKVRNATDQEWDQADPYLNFRVTANNPGRGLKPDQKLFYLGKDFPKTGSKWPLSMEISRVSQDGSFLAVNSWDGIVEGCDLNELCWGETIRGRYFVDIYNVTSVQLVLHIGGEFHGIDPDSMFRDSAWISKSYFVLPLDWENRFRQFIVCDVRRAAAELDLRPNAGGKP